MTSECRVEGDPAVTAHEAVSLLTRGPLFVLAQLMLAPSHVWGVPAGEVSWGADMVGMLRAIASQHPDPRLRNPDHLAQRLCPRPFELRDHAAARQVMAAAPEAWAGYFYVNARTHHIDAVVHRAAREGVTQVVILGAGFDSRAYRMHSGHPALRFFEVDLPAVIRAKIRRLRQAFIPLHEQVSLVAVDFERQSLADVLPSHGYDASSKTLFILEGVTMYISEAGNAATLDFVRRAAAGSRVVYDYLLADAMTGDRSAFYGMAYAAEALVAHNEPLVTAWTQAQAAAFARAHGLQLVEDLSTDELAQCYLIGGDGQPDGRWLEGNRIIEAKVRAKA